MADKAMPTVLVVDDEEEILFSLESLLRLDFDVRLARSGTEAIEILDAEPVHAVMTDQRMPGMTGVEFLARARERHPDVVRLIFTGYADIKAVIDAINEGSVYRYITKPWDAEELVAIVRQACAQHEQLAERRGLLEQLRGCHDRFMNLLGGLQDGTLGNLNDAGQAEANTLIESGRPLADSLSEHTRPPSTPAGRG